MLILAILAGCAARPYYAATSIGQPGVGDESLALSVELDLATGRIQSLTHADGEPLEASELPHPVLRVLFDAATRWGAGGEFDILAEEPLAVTVWMSPKRHATVDWAEAIVPAVPTLTELEESVRQAGLVLEAPHYGPKWRPGELAEVVEALQALSSDELALLSGYHLGRAEVSWHRPADLALYDPSGQHPRIDLFDVAWEETDGQFVGPVRAPISPITMTMVHEFAHAIADADAHEAFREALNAASPELRRQKWREAGWLARHSPTINRWKKLRLPPGPSPYARGNKHESFAEAFALYKLDPEALERVMPEALVWFRAGNHLPTP